MEKDRYKAHIFEDGNHSKESEGNQNTAYRRHICGNLQTVQNIKAVQINAEIALKCLATELHTAIENRTSLEKYLHECEFQNHQLDLEQRDKMELNKEIETVDTIINILKWKFEAYTEDLNKSKSETLKYKNKIDEVFNSYVLYKEAFKEEFEMNNNYFQEYQKQFVKQSNVTVSKERFNKEIKLGDMIKLHEDLTNMEKNQELLDKAKWVQGVKKSKDDVKKQQEKLKLITAKKIKLLKQQHVQYEVKTNERLLEKDILKQRLIAQQQYLRDLVEKLDSLESENVNLLSTKDKIKKEIFESQKKCNDLIKSLEESTSTTVNNKEIKEVSSSKM